MPTNKLVNMASQKIVVISLDYWNYDKHIIHCLQLRGIESQHINLGDYKHPSFAERLKNFFYKLFLQKNLKKIKRQEYVVERLKKLGIQDQVLVINPDLISKEFHLKIKENTKKYIAYLYDSLARYPVEGINDGIFDEVYSFDDHDVRNYGLKKTTNFNYLEKKEYRWIENPKYQLFFLSTLDSRINFLKKIAEKLNQLRLSYQFIVVTKKIPSMPNIVIRKERILQEDLHLYYNQTNVILDLVQDNQSGLSFRIFEAMAYQKKVITSNASIKSYDFYNPVNTMVIDEENLDIDQSFFLKPYEPLPEDIYTKYTIDYWVKTIFNL